MKILSVKVKPEYDDMYPHLYWWFKGEGVLDHLANRYCEPHEEIKNLLPQIYKKAKIKGDPKKAYFDQRAGCLCGCSPGFILVDAEREMNGKMSRFFDVYVKLSMEEQNEAAENHH